MFPSDKKNDLHDKFDPCFIILLCYIICFSKINFEISPYHETKKAFPNCQKMAKKRLV
mgnify:CR=1 FL=1